MTSAIHLALGTAQFGMPYGIAGRRATVPEAEVRSILEVASGAGVSVLDTAPAYGDIEARLDGLTQGLTFSVVSKIPAVPAREADPGAFVRASVEQSIRRLGSRLRTLLFHDADDLLRPDGEVLWRAATEAAGNRVRLGVSLYDPRMAMVLRGRYPLRVVQVPANALDQRVAAPETSQGLMNIEVHARSAFLQGLLLLPHAEAIYRVPAASADHAKWTAWCKAEGVSPLIGALSVARALPGVSLWVVGVDSAAQLRHVLEAAGSARPCTAASVACDDPEVIDPRRWPATVRTW